METTSDSGGSPGWQGPALVYFAKAPRPGVAKTRLCPPLTPAEAAGLYAGFLQDVLRAEAGFRTFVYGWPADGLAEIQTLAAQDVTARPQCGDDLWTRMTACFEELFAEGYGPVVLRNTDSPDLPGERVHEAAAAATDGTVVLGPDAGGGYYLVALANLADGLFDGLDEGASTVFAAQVARAETLGQRVVALPEARDVDTFDDLLALWRERRSQSPE